MVSQVQSRDRWTWRVATLLAILAVGAVMLQWTWRTWPDVLVDFGQQIYTAWRITEGDLLYRDAAYLYGPLSPYVNSIWLRFFGTSILALCLCNLAIAGAIIAMLHALLERIGGKLSAAVGSMLCVTLFVFGQYTPTGNYNYLAPYSHEMTHGLALSLLALLILARGGRRPIRASLTAGISIGLVFLTKPEVFLAGFAAAACFLALGVWQSSYAKLRRRLLTPLAFALGLVLPVAACAALFMTAVPPKEAVQSAVAAWPHALDSRVASLPFFQHIMGLDDPAASVTRMVEPVLLTLMILAPAAGLALMLRLGRAGELAAAAIAAIVAIALLWQTAGSLVWFNIARPWPIVLLVLIAAESVKLLRRKRPQPADPNAALRISFLVLALALMLKMALNARLYHYGFVLAMPSALVMAAALMDWIPATLARLGGSKIVFRAVAGAALIVLAVVYLGRMSDLIATKTFEVGAGSDRIVTDVRGLAAQRTLDELASQARPEQTLAAVPEGVMLNYLARRRNPTPYNLFMPLELTIYGEAAWRDSFAAHPPDFIAIVHKDTTEHGLPLFGRDYAPDFYNWIQQNYEPVHLEGLSPLKQPEAFGILLMRHRAAPG